MGRRIKKGTTGVAAQYVARSKAVRMLQISLKDFRRLCILKGIYPRDPKRKPGNNASATYYHKKDILYLSHEPLLHKFRTFKTFLKKYHKAQSRAEGTKAKAIRGRKPEMILDHLVRERFPTFSDALRDLDDCLNMVHLYAGLPSGISQGHSAARTASCTTLMREFQNYLIQCREMTAPERSGMLKKVFVSIKGYYFEAEIQGEIVRWMMPHKLVQDPKVADVDFRVMMVFLDFYETMLKFVNFKLYHDIGLVYPPAINTDSESRGLGLSHIISNTKLENEDVDQEKEILADAQEFSTLDTDSELPVTTALATRKRLIFKGLKFFLSRETPMEILEFVILALGGEAVLENPESAKPDGITHQIVDRNWPAENREEGREYVQPQWVFDSINESALLPVRPYAPVILSILNSFVDFIIGNHSSTSSLSICKRRVRGLCAQAA